MRGGRAPSLLPAMAILTHRKRIPWIWAFLISFPWVSSNLLERISTEPLTFTLRKFIDDPGLIALLASVNILFNFMVGVGTAYLSDHLWTSWGRRKPFLIASFGSAGLMLAIVPIVGNVWILALTIVVYQFFVDFGKPWEPLYNEVVPPKQRGRTGIFRMMLSNLGALFFSTVLIGQFDHVYSVQTPFGALSGEQVLYWSCSLLMIATALFLGMFVKETLAPRDPDDPEGVLHPTRYRFLHWLGRREKGWRVVTGLFAAMFGDRQNLWIFVLYLCPVLATSVVGANQVLFLTDQLGLSKADLGKLHALTMPFMVFAFTPLAGVLADRISRLVMMRVGIGVPALIQFGFFLYLRFSVDYQPTFALLVGVGILTSFFQSWLWAVWGPVVYDYIPSNRMGTCVAGITFTAGVAGFLLINLGGLWVKGWTAVLGPSGRGTFDYSSILVLNLVMAAVAVAVTALFEFAVRRGWVRPEGRLEIAELPNGAE